jgi:LemA protein
MISIISLSIIVILIILVWIIVAYNSFIRLKNQVENSWAQIDVQLKRRADLIPNLINTVKGYAKHEKEVLENVTKARGALINANSLKEKSEANNMLTDALKSLFAVSENYPDLKANQNFLQLQEELTGTENKIAAARQYYNDMVMEYNTKRETFPSNLIASLFNFKEKEMFEIKESEKEVPKVSF